MAALLTGLAAGLGLIVAIGAQNAYVIRQGLLRRHHLPIAALCFVVDAALIVVGVAGLGAVIAGSVLLARAAAWGGAALLLLLGGLALRRAWSGGRALDDGPAAPKRLGPALMTALALSVLNPHVYLDTVILLGGIGAQYPGGERILFAAGAIMASAVWFFGVALAASAAAPLLRRPGAVRLLDAVIAAIMIGLGCALAAGVLT